VRRLITLAAFAGALVVPPPASAAIHYLTQWGQNGSGDGQFRNPQGIAVGPDGFVYVADAGNQRIEKFTRDGVFVLKWGGTFGTNPGQFRNPRGIDVNAVGGVYVADRDNARIQRFDTSGNFLSQFGSSGSTPGQFFVPGDLATTSDRLYVADTGNHRIQRFSLLPPNYDPSTYTQWGGMGSANGTFSSPNDVAIDAAGNLYVTDAGNHRVQKFDPDGNFLISFGSNGSGPGQFVNAAGIEVDPGGNVWVVDNSNAVQEFTSDGTFVRGLGPVGALAPESSRIHGTWPLTRTGTFT